MEINKIYNIDCFDGFKGLEDNSVDHVFTSPPYNRKHFGLKKDQLNGVKSDKYKYSTDNIDDYFGFLCNVIDESYVYDIKIQYMDTNLSLVHKSYSEFLEDIPSNIKLLIFDFKIK